MNESEFCSQIRSAVSAYNRNDEEFPFCHYYETFAARKITTGAYGFVFVMRDGSEFQVSVVKSKLETDHQ